MRKTLLISSLILSAAVSVPIQASETPVVLPQTTYFSVYPGMLTKDGESFLYTYTRNGGVIDRFYVYGEDMQLIKEIEPVKFPVLESVTYTQERIYAYESIAPDRLDQWNFEPLEINGQSEGLSIERVQAYLFAQFSQGEISSLSDGTPIVVRWFYDEDRYGKKYPQCYWKEVDGKWYEFYQNYTSSGEYGPFGEWGEVSENIVKQEIGVESIDIIPGNGGESNYFRLTKGIFGDDYSYIIPEYVPESFNDEYEYYGKPGWIWKKSWGTTYKCKGYQIYDSSNKQIASFDLPAGDWRYVEELYYFTMGDIRYFAIECEGRYGNSDNGWLVVYRLDSNNNVSFVTAAPTANISPRNPKRGEKVTVSLDSAVGTEGAMVQVVSASGQTMLSTKVPAGQSQLDINTSGFSQGIYVVNVFGSGINKEAAKIIVR